MQWNWIFCVLFWKAPAEVISVLASCVKKTVFLKGNQGCWGLWWHSRSKVRKGLFLRLTVSFPGLILIPESRLFSSLSLLLAEIKCQVETPGEVNANQLG